jgi:Holliday junction resolvasome RuvABC endonuclease subunit
VRVFGIDPGIGGCGFAVLDVPSDYRPAIVDAGAFWSSDKHATVAVRVNEFARDFSALFAEHRPAVVVVETPVHGIRNVTASVMLWSAYAVVLGASARQALVIDRTPDQWRAALGLPTRHTSPKASGLTAGASRAQRKRESAGYVKNRFPGLLGLLAASRCPSDARSHAYDAIAIACAWIDRAAHTNQTTAAHAPLTSEG